MAGEIPAESTVMTQIVSTWDYTYTDHEVLPPLVLQGRKLALNVLTDLWQHTLIVFCNVAIGLEECHPVKWVVQLPNNSSQLTHLSIV